MPPPSCTGISSPTSAQDRLDRRLVDRLAGERAVQVDQVQPPRAGVEPAPRHRGRVFAEGGGVLHVALFQAHAVTVLEVDRRNQQHGRGRRWREEAARDGASGSGSGVPVQEVAVQGQAVVGALLGVELGGENVIARQRAR